VFLMNWILIWKLSTISKVVKIMTCLCSTYLIRVHCSKKRSEKAREYVQDPKCTLPSNSIFHKEVKKFYFEDIFRQIVTYREFCNRYQGKVLSRDLQKWRHNFQMIFLHWFSKTHMLILLIVSITWGSSNNN
jgi:hypothetical protein